MINWLVGKLCVHKYDRVEKGYQYCKHCGLARLVPVLPCLHPKWKRTESYKLESMNMVTKETNKTGEVFVLECEQCGDLKEFRVGVQWNYLIMHQKCPL